MKKTALVCMLLSIAALNAKAENNLSNQQPLAADEAYVLIDLGARGTLRQYVTALNFKNKYASAELSVSEGGGMQLVKVKAGTYIPDTFVTHSQHRKSLRKRAKGIYVEPGSITYIGNWKVSYGQSFMVNNTTYSTEKTSLGVHYNVGHLQSFAAKNQWVTNYPLRVSHMNGKRVASDWQALQGS